MKIQFGCSSKCINPEIPISLAGYFNRRMWDKVLDDLEVRALVLKDGDETAVILHFDLLAIPVTFYNAVQEAVKVCGIAPEKILIAATHTHTAPNLSSEPNSAAYREFAAAKAAEALKDALNNMKEGTVYTAQASDCRFQFNRRYWMQDGRVVTNPGKLNPAIVRPEGEIDPEIPVIAIKTSAGIEVLITSAVNHTDTIGGCGVSSDWPGFMRRELAKVMAPGAIHFPMVGTSGNINHFDTRTDMNQTCYAEPERIGKGYAESVIAVLPELKEAPGCGLKIFAAKAVSAPRELDPAEIAEAQAVVDKYPEIDLNAASKVDLTSEDLAKGTPYALKYFANALLKIANNTRNPEFLLTGIKLGDATVIASLPSEPFVEIGLTLRKEIFRNNFCLVTSHGNYNGGEGYFGGYIPNPWNYGRGGYEDTPRSSGYSVRTSGILLDAWRKLAEKF